MSSETGRKKRSEKENNEKGAQAKEGNMFLNCIFDVVLRCLSFLAFVRKTENILVALVGFSFSCQRKRTILPFSTQSILLNSKFERRHHRTKTRGLSGAVVMVDLVCDTTPASGTMMR